MPKENCVGFLQLVYFGHKSGEVLTLGGAGFLTKKEYREAWSAVPDAGQKTDFMADRMDAQRDIVEDRQVTQSVVERLLGQPLKTLVDAAWVKLEQEKIEYAAA